MDYPVIAMISNIEDQYVAWSEKNESTKEINCSIARVDVKIIFNKGYYIYPLLNCTIPAFISHTVNIVSTENKKIKALFKEYLQKPNDQGEYLFPKDRLSPFKIRCFSNESLLKEEFRKEKEEYDRYKAPILEEEYPPYEIHGACILI